MTAYTRQTAPTQFVEANGIRFAYRRFGKSGGVPLVFNQHLTGTMDHWDPAVTDGLARDRDVILFNNAKTMSSTPRREPWNKGKLIGQKPPLRPKHLWSIRTGLQMDGWTRDLAYARPAVLPPFLFTIIYQDLQSLIRSRSQGAYFP